MSWASSKQGERNLWISIFPRETGNHRVATAERRDWDQPRALETPGEGQGLLWKVAFFKLSQQGGPLWDEL